MAPPTPDVSVITPVHNAAEFLPACLRSLVEQTFLGTLQLCVYDDASTDNSRQVLEDWRGKLEARGVEVILNGSKVGDGCRGQGYARNRAIECSTGRFLCFLDADDVMTPDRVSAQFSAAVDPSAPPLTLFGSSFVRDPPDSTARYAAWANRLTPAQLHTQAYTSHGPTLILPTWFCAREVFARQSGGFVETGPGTPEDYVFFLRHIATGGALVRVPRVLLTYRYHAGSVTNVISERTIWDVRVEALSRRVIDGWAEFTIWSAGKQGRRLYRSLDESSRAKVHAFCDVDQRKIAKGAYTFEGAAPFREYENSGAAARSDGGGSVVAREEKEKGSDLKEISRDIVDLPEHKDESADGFDGLLLECADSGAASSSAEVCTAANRSKKRNAKKSRRTALAGSAPKRAGLSLKPRVPIVHFRDARPPFVICVKMDLTGGGLEENLASLGLTEGVDYFHFN